MQYIIFDRKTGKKANKKFNTLKEAIAEANKLNEKINCYNFLITTIK